jgi:hypothetical protein
MEAAPLVVALQAVQVVQEGVEVPMSAPQVLEFEVV